MKNIGRIIATMVIWVVAAALFYFFHILGILTETLSVLVVINGLLVTIDVWWVRHPKNQ